ncbi:MAG: thiamine diphosphokinase [Dehalococcoidia bacterium]
MRVLLFADGEMPSLALIQELANAADVVFAADGGADKALSAGVRPDAVVGDLDSVSAEARRTLGEAAFHHAPSPDSTDLQKAIELALDRGATAIDIVAAGGGRADHALANLSVLPLYRGRARLRVVDDLFEVTLVEETVRIDAPVGTVVSLVAIGLCTGVTTTGLRWDLADHELVFSPYGVHNEVARPPATVSVEAGDLLLFRGRWVEKHA